MEQEISAKWHEIFGKSKKFAVAHAEDMKEGKQKEGVLGKVRVTTSTVLLISRQLFTEARQLFTESRQLFTESRTRLSTPRLAS